MRLMRFGIPDYVIFKGLYYYPLINYCEKNLIKRYKLYLALEEKRKEFESEGVVFD